MSMSAFSIIDEIPLEQGFTKLGFVPFYAPTVLIFDKKDAQNIGSKKLGSDEPKKGVYVIVETDPSWGRYNVTVGLGGVGGEKQTLLNRVKYHDYSPPSVMEDWNKAILICDWEKDIRNRAFNYNSASKENQKKKIDEAMASEVHLIEKMLHEELMEFNEDLGSLRVHRNQSSNFTHYMPNPDNERYDYYIRVVMEALRKIVPKYDEQRTRSSIRDLIKKQLLAEGDTVYGSFDSEAKIIDKKGNAKVTRFKKKTKNAGKKDLEELEGISLSKTASAILEANDRTGNVHASKFWYVIKNNELVAIEDLEES